MFQRLSRVLGLSKWGVGLATVSLLTLPLAAGAVENSSYILEPDSNVFSVHHYLTTSEYTLDGSIDPLAEYATTTSFLLESGDAFRWYCGDGFVDPNEGCDRGSYGTNLNGLSCVTQGYDAGTIACTTACALDVTGCSNNPSNGGGGGGGGGGTVVAAAPTVNSDVLSGNAFTFASSALLYGTMSSGFTVRVNGSGTGVTYPTTTSWQVSTSLTTGTNTFTVQAYDGGGNASSSTVASYVRHALADVNGDGVVNDYDLSRVARYWLTDRFESDFNIDKIVNDYDFSILVSRWS